jgi:acetyltransferase-like isoleucine patch superfamily enzyme
MSNDDGTKVIRRGTPESAAFFESTRRAMKITPIINQLTFDDADKIRVLFSDLIGKKVDDDFRLIPPFYTASGLKICVGQHVFINQNCTIYDLAEINIGDNVMIGPNVSIISAGHSLSPSRRYDGVQGKPIVIENNVWIAAGVTIIGGVTVGENSVIAAGSVVTHDVPSNTLVGGNPAKIIRSIID